MPLEIKKDPINLKKNPVGTESAVAMDDLCYLANKFVEQHLYDEAINIYESAARLYPQNLALKINLGRAKNLKKQTISRPDEFLEKQRAEEEKKRRNFFNKFQGLGEIYNKIGRIPSSKKIFELTKISNPDFYLPYLNLGKMYYQEKNFAKAIEELEVCARQNPFSEEIYNYLSLSYFYVGEYHKALIAMIDALLLSGDLIKDVPTSYQQKINLIMERIDGFTPEMRNQLIKTRREKLNTLYQEMEKDIKELLSEKNDLVVTKPEERIVKEEHENVFDLALSLKSHLLFKSLDDETLIKIAKFTTRHHYLKDDYIYRDNEPAKGLYILQSGKVELRKETSFGHIAYGTFDKGGFFGEQDLIIGRNHWMNLYCVEECNVFFLEKGGFPELFAKQKHVAIHFLWYFWKSLSFQIRESNEKMKGFFRVVSSEIKERPAGIANPHTKTFIEMSRKLEALEGKGLSPMEMRLLATFSDATEHRFGEYVFRDGDPGDRLYIILDGQVLISKNIPGVGEEALAVLNRGDFFGEMALLGDDNMRSADAKANSDRVKLIGIKKEALKEILSIDSESAYQFLSILTRILSLRLHEINEKIFQWKIMQGGF